MTDETFCTITHDRFVDPVVCSDGHTYERAAIAKCLEMGLPSPSSNLKGVTIVAPNWMARKTVERTHEIELPPSKHVRTTINEEGDMIDACKNGDLDRVRVSIQAGANVNAVDEDGDTPLHHASRYGRFEIVKALIQAEADVNAANKHGWIPLHHASYHDHTEIVLILIQAGANVNVTNEDGNTSLHLACIYNITEIVKVLIQARADVNARKANGWTPLRFASYNGHTEIVKILKKAGAHE